MKVSFAHLASAAAVVLVVACSVSGGGGSVSADSTSRRSAGATDNVVWPKTTDTTHVVGRQLNRFDAPPANGRERVPVTSTTVRYAHEHQHLVPATSHGPTDRVVNRFLVIPENRCMDGQTLSSAGRCVDAFDEDDNE